MFGGSEGVEAEGGEGACSSTAHNRTNVHGHVLNGAGAAPYTASRDNRKDPREFLVRHSPMVVSTAIEMSARGVSMGRTCRIVTHEMPRCTGYIARRAVKGHDNRRLEPSPISKMCDSTLNLQHLLSATDLWKQRRKTYGASWGPYIERKMGGGAELD